MADFVCEVCGEKFSLPEEVLAKYPNWKPKYCRKHSPKKNGGAAAAEKQPARKGSGAGENLTLAEVLARFEGGPETGIFTDGSARPNPGPGGWGLVRVAEDKILAQAHGSSEFTTNNRMELTALIEAFKMLSPDDEETVYSDSELCVNILTKWAPSWERQGWKRKTGPIENLDLVQEAYALFRQRPKVKLSWIKAHNGWRWNEYANSLAGAWARKEL